MHPDNWSVSPLYDGSALMGTPGTKTFTGPWRLRGARGYRFVTITQGDQLYVIVIPLAKNLAKTRVCSSTKVESIGQHTGVSPETAASVRGDWFPLPCLAVVK
jgi:hypothetical protein